MSSTTVSVSPLARGERWVLLLSALGVAGALYGFLAFRHTGADVAGEGMHHAPVFGPGAAAWLFAMWLAMMVAMMLPPVLPWIWVFASATKGRGEAPPRWARTALFASGYFGLWALYSLAAVLAQVLLQHYALLHPVTLRVSAVGGAVLLLVAGVVQLTPLKWACLKHCRSPLGFFLAHWKDGPSGAFSMGFRHGVYCLGCCWALMSLSFALGTMNLVWMAVVTLLLCVEKIAPGGERWSRAFGIGFLAWGAWLLVA